MRSMVITSTGRTGTRMLADLLLACASDAEIHHNSRNTALINCITNASIDGLLPKSAPRIALTLLKRRELAACENELYVDSNNHLFGVLDAANELYPDLAVAHIVRDPREYVRSHINWAYSRTKSYVANFIIPFWQPNGWLAGEIKRPVWTKMDAKERFSWTWSFKNRIIERIEMTPIPYARFRLEDLTLRSSEGAALYAFLHFAGLKQEAYQSISSGARINRSSSEHVPRWTEWQDWECTALDWWCGSRMREYGYGREEAWQEKVRAGAKNLPARYINARTALRGPAD